MIDKIKRFLWLFKATFRPKQRVMMTHQIIVRYFKMQQWKYWVDNTETTYHLSFPIADLNVNMVMRLNINETLSLIRLVADLERPIEEHQSDAVHQLIVHFNQIVHFGSVKRNADTHLPVYYADFGLIDALMDEAKFHDMVHAQMCKCYDLSWCLQQVIELGEDPVVVIGELLRKHDVAKKAS